MAYGQVSMKHASTLGKSYTEQLGYTNYTLAQLEDTTTGAAQNVEDLGRAITSLSTDSYGDTYVTFKVSMAEIISE